jgi:phospho-N-acetylmuramoyl-pentapeptide-transferase
MGGLLILLAALVPALAVSLYTIPGLTIVLATLGCASIGFTDDYLKQRRSRSLGLKGRWKMLGLVLITAGSPGRRRGSATWTRRSTSRSST